MIITIDGPAGSGKSTVASILAKKLGFIHFNSGSLYRGITAHLLANNIDVDNIDNIPILENLSLDVEFINGVQHVFVNKIDYTNNLRASNVSTLTPIVSVNKKVRALVDKTQREIAKNNNLVIDGRDIGSYVFPNAEIKFYLDCNIKVRAKRRQKELGNDKYSLKEIEKMLFERDEYDKNKKVAPLVVPKNAIVIDSSNLTVDEVVNKMLSHINLKHWNKLKILQICKIFIFFL